MADTSVKISLSDLVRLALPSGSGYLVGEAHRARLVNWTVSVGVPLRREELMQDGDFVIVAVRSDDPDWEAAIKEFIGLNVAAIASNQPIPQSALQIADKAGLPVIGLPAGSDLRDAHRGALTTLLKREAQIAQRTNDISRQLFRLAAEDVDLDMIAGEIAKITGRGVILQDKRLRVMVDKPLREIDDRDWMSVTKRITDPKLLPDGWSDRRFAAKNRGRVEQQSIAERYQRLVTPIVVKHLARGYLSFIAAENEIDTLDTMLIEQGAAAYAMAMSKAKAVSDTTKRLRGDFIDAVLAGSIPAAELERWAGRLGHHIDSPHSVVVFSWGETKTGAPPSQRRLETIVNSEIGLGRLSALVRNSQDEVAAFIALDERMSIASARSLSDSVFELATQDYPRTKIYCGIGRPARNVHEWAVSHREATQAMGTARRLDESRPLYFGDLSVHRLLFQLQGYDELEQFCNESIGPLLEYDAKHNSTLIKTLTVYFEHLGNLTQTAEALYIHRNTLQYRMERIGEIAGLDLDNPETRLAVQLALKAYKLLPEY